MSGIASVLMVASASLCLIGAIGSRNRTAVAASVVMLLAMVDVAYVSLLPPVDWAGVLLITGLGVATTLRSASRAALPQLSSVAADTSHDTTTPSFPSLSTSDQPPRLDVPESGRFRPFRRVRRTSAMLSAMAYPIMAWQILGHGSRIDASATGGSTAGAAIAHQHSTHAFDPSSISVIITLVVFVLALLLVLCALQALTRRRRALMLECLGMAAMISVMQFLH